MYTIIKDVKRECWKRNLTLTDVANKMGMIRNNFYLCIKNPSIRLSTVHAIADAIGCNIADLFQSYYDDEE